MLKIADVDLTEVIRQFNEWGIGAAFLVPTETGLKKSIMDATSSVRAYLKAAGLHDYDEQHQGTANRIFRKAYLVYRDRLKETKVSLYRPETKSGDPRLWIYGLQQYALPGNALAILAVEDELFVINASRKDVIASAEVRDSPLSQLISRFAAPKAGVVIELLGKLRGISQLGFLPTTVVGSTGIGATLEHHLGIQMNPNRDPDFKGIELKARRSARVPTRSTLFAQVPNWELSALKSSKEILLKYGYQRRGVMRLNCTVSAEKPNSQGLYFDVRRSGDHLMERHSNKESKIFTDVATWEFNKLREVLAKKHAETFWVVATSRDVNGREHFHYNKVTHTKSPNIHVFDTLVEIGAVTMDHLIKETRVGGPAHERGPLFKILPSNLDLLFPPSTKYDLTSA